MSTFGPSTVQLTKSRTWTPETLTGHQLTSDSASYTPNLCAFYICVNIKDQTMEAEITPVMKADEKNRTGRFRPLTYV